jgi:hypothetical protein
MAERRIYLAHSNFDTGAYVFQADSEVPVL